MVVNILSLFNNYVGRSFYSYTTGVVTNDESSRKGQPDVPVTDVPRKIEEDTYISMQNFSLLLADVRLMQIF